MGFRKSVKNKLVEALLAQGDCTRSCGQKECSGERLKTLSEGMGKKNRLYDKRDIIAIKAKQN